MLPLIRIRRSKGKCQEERTKKCIAGSISVDLCKFIVIKKVIKRANVADSVVEQVNRELERVRRTVSVRRGDELYQVPFTKELC